MNIGRVVAMTKKEARELIRDPVTITVALLLPLVMLFLFGYAISLDVKDIHFAVWDRDNTRASRELSDAFVHSRYFTFSGSTDMRGASAALERGGVRMVLVIPENFERNFVAEEPSPVQILIDGSNSNIATIVAGYADAIVSSFRHTSSPTAVEPELRVWYNPELRSANYVIPGLLGVILMAFPPLLTALAVVREKESRSIEQIFASPLTASEFLAGKLIPYAVIAFIEFLMVAAVGLMWFQVPFRGSFLLLSSVAIIYVFCTVGLGLLVSTLAKTQVAAMLLALVVTLMPSALFSGFLFPVFTMPYALQLYSASFPARYFVELSRDIALKGANANDVRINIALLIVYTIVVFVIATWRIKKKVA